MTSTQTGPAVLAGCAWALRKPATSAFSVGRNPPTRQRPTSSRLVLCSGSCRYCFSIDDQIRELENRFLPVRTWQYALSTSTPSWGSGTGSGQILVPRHDSTTRSSPDRRQDKVWRNRGTQKIRSRMEPDLGHRPPISRFNVRSISYQMPGGTFRRQECHRNLP